MAEYIKLSEFEKAVFVKQEEEKRYWFDWLKQFRATKEYPIKETAVDNFLRGYGEAVQHTLSVNEQLLLKAVDVVEVVRCKDCEYAKEYKNILFCCYYPRAPKSVSSNDYCSYGIRKDGEENGL